MKKLLLLSSLAFMFMNGGLGVEQVEHEYGRPAHECIVGEDIGVIYSQTRFYQDLTDEEKSLVDYLINDQHDAVLTLSIRTIDLGR